MYPNINVNYLAIAAAVFASFMFGWLWYGPLFGKKWAALMNMPMDQKPDPQIMMRGMALMVLGTILTTWVLLHSSDSGVDPAGS